MSYEILHNLAPKTHPGSFHLSLLFLPMLMPKWVQKSFRVFLEPSTSLPRSRMIAGL